MSIPKLPSYNIHRAASCFSNKVAWQVDPKRAVLLIHDMQQYFLDFYGPDSTLIAQLVRNIKTLKDTCHKLEIPVVYTAQPPEQRVEDRALLSDFWGPGLNADKNQHHICAALSPSDQDTCLVKWRYSAFQRTALHQMMHEQKRDQLIVCGVYAHIGILATCLEAFMTDIQAFMVVDAVADFSEKDHDMAADYIAQRCGVAITMENVTAQIRNTCDRNGLFSLDSVTQDIAAILHVSASDIQKDDELMDLGMDSIRLMELVERWRHVGASVQFMDVAECQTVEQCCLLLIQNSNQSQEHKQEATAHG